MLIRHLLLEVLVLLDNGQAIKNYSRIKVCRLMFIHLISKIYYIIIFFSELIEHLLDPFSE